MRTEDLFYAFDELDAELLYDAHAKPQRKQYVTRRMAIAASFVLLIAISFILYGLFISPTSYIYLDSQKSITVSLNARGRVLSVMENTELRPGFSGKRYNEAASELIAEMVENGSINASENTLIIGADNLSQADQETLFTTSIDTLANYNVDAAVISVKCRSSDTGTTASPSVSRMIELLYESDSSLDPYHLSRLSANDLAILLTDRDISNPDITVSGAVSDSGHIGFEAATAKALSLSSFQQSDIDDINLSYSVYHDHLIYVVTIKSGNHSEAYFINTHTGSTEQAIKAPTEQLKDEVDREIKSTSEAAPPHMSEPTETSSTAQPVDGPTEVETTLAGEAAAHSAPTQLPTEAESDDYTSVSISMKELSFVVQEVPEVAKQAKFDTLFEGQCFNTRNGEKQNTGSVALITTYTAMQKYLSDNAYPYVDRDGNSPSAGIDKSYFKDHSIIAVSGIFSDASYYARLTDIKTTDTDVYLEASLSYGESRSGEFYCRTLTLYGIDNNLIHSTDNIIVY